MSVIGSERVTPPPVPTALIVYVPVLVALVAVNVRTEVPLPGVAKLVFEKDAVTPVGRPVELTAIAELKAPESWLDKLT